MVREYPYVDLFWECVPREFLRKLLRELAFSYPKAADRNFDEFEPSEAVNVIPFERRALIETGFRRSAEGFDEITMSVRRAGTWNYSLATCGQKVILTQNKAPSPDDVVRRSFFKLQHAVANRQLMLFEGSEPPPIPPSTNLYGIVLHGSASDNPYKLGFAEVRFPLKDLTGYHAGRIDLMREFPDVLKGVPEQGIPGKFSPEEWIDEPSVDFDAEEDVG